MAGKRSGVRIPINNQRMEAMVEICDEMLEEFRPGNDHQYLLREYLEDLKQRLKDMLKKEQDNYILVLTGTEAIAFYQLWQMMDISHDKYATLIVDNLLKKMSSLAA